MKKKRISFKIQSSFLVTVQLGSAFCSMSWLPTLTTLGGCLRGNVGLRNPCFPPPLSLPSLTRGVPVAPQKDDQLLAPGGGAPLSQGDIVAT